MKKLYKHKLNFDYAFNYIKSQLDNVNVFSSELLNNINFKDGCFFTLLPEDANLEKINDFKSGEILPQQPLEERIINGCKFSCSRVPDIDLEISLLIFDIVKKNNWVCIFDDVTCSVESLKGYHLFESNGLSFNNESYYFLSENNISHDKVLECLKNSTSFWHSLNLFTAYTDVQPGNLNLDKIQMICKKTQSIMVGAYDGEGYTFWEKENNMNKNRPYSL